MIELCKGCPMRDERYETTNQADRRQIADLQHGLERRGDFIEFLFDHSEHCDHITYLEAWEEFEAWEDKRDKEPEPTTKTPTP